MRRHDLLTQKQTAERLGVADRTLRGWVKDGYFPKPLRIGRTPYYAPETIASFFNEQASS